MPIFDYKCVCGHRVDDNYIRTLEAVVTCSKCGNLMQRQFPANSRFYPKCFPAEGIFLEHVCPEGKTFHSEREMKDYAKKHNLELGALL